MEAKQLYEFDKDLTDGIPIRQMIGTFDIYKLRWNKKLNDENASRKKSIISEIDRCISPEPGIHELVSKFSRYGVRLSPWIPALNVILTFSK